MSVSRNDLIATTSFNVGVISSQVLGDDRLALIRLSLRNSLLRRSHNCQVLQKLNDFDTFIDAVQKENYIQEFFEN